MDTMGVFTATTLPVHIVAGGLALAAGYVALYATKGATLHRRSGLLFVGAMVVMSVTGMVVAAVEGEAPAINIPAAMLAFYLVVTSLTTVRPPVSWSRPVDVAGMLLAFALGLACTVLAVAAIAGGGRSAGMAYPLVMFAAVGVLGGVGDLRMLRAGGVRGAARLRRHLWRMCLALALAAMAFFLGQADEFPRALRIMPVLALPVLAVLATMFAWLWRIRGRRRVPVITGGRAPHSAAMDARVFQ